MKVVGTLSRAAERHPRKTVVVAAFVVALGVLTGLVAWAVSSPFGTTPDDDYHMVSIYCPDPGSSQCPVVGHSATGRAMVEAPQDILARLCYLERTDASGECVGWAGPDGPRIATDRVNLGEYPGAYYAIMHIFSSDDVNQMELTIRLVNCALAAAIVFALLVLLEPVGRRVFVWTVAATAVPMVPYLVSSVAPDSWSFMGVTATLAALVGLFRAEERWRRAGLAVTALLGAGMCAAARADAGALAVLVTVVVCLVHRRQLVGRQQLAARWGTALTVLGMLGLGLSGFVAGSQSSAVSEGFAGYGDDAQTGPVRLFFENAVYLPDWMTYMWWRGILDMGTFSILGDLLFVGAVVMVWCGLFRGGMTWEKAVGVALTGGALLGAPLALLQAGNSPLGAASGMQPRYLVPFLIAAVGVTLVPVAGRTGCYLSTRAAVSYWAMLVLVQSATLNIWIRRWVTGLDVKGINLDQNVEWWRDIPLSPNAVWILGSLGLAVAAGAVVAVRWQPPVQTSGAAEVPAGATGPSEVVDPAETASPAKTGGSTPSAEPHESGAG
ncbi:MAG: DUF2142 domain-containing protein [Micrococcales bacterium]|nr:DUF2142 domain-containing protein [Micrococcales bacterium]